MDENIRLFGPRLELNSLCKEHFELQGGHLVRLSWAMITWTVIKGRLKTTGDFHVKWGKWVRGEVVRKKRGQVYAWKVFSDPEENEEWRGTRRKKRSLQLFVSFNISFSQNRHPFLRHPGLEDHWIEGIWRRMNILKMSGSAPLFQRKEWQIMMFLEPVKSKSVLERGTKSAFPVVRARLCQEVHLGSNFQMQTSVKRSAGWHVSQFQCQNKHIVHTMDV